MIGFDAKTSFAQCNDTKPSNNKLTNIFDWAQEAGLKTGFVTTTRVTHATPAALYSHVSSRYWEDDSKVPIVYRSTCKDIARQLLEGTPGRNINVIMGGGRRSFVPSFASSDRRNGSNVKKGGRRLDGRNLIYEWIREKISKKSNSAQYVTTKTEMFNLHNEAEFLLGLFENSHLSFHCDRLRDEESREQPSLTEMTLTAIEVLTRKSEGFVLVVESGRIDHAHHHNNAFRALDETLALEEAVDATLKSKKISKN